jgi:hypothetical protein
MLSPSINNRLTAFIYCLNSTYINDSHAEMQEKCAQSAVPLCAIVTGPAGH